MIFLLRIFLLLCLCSSFLGISGEIESLSMVRGQSSYLFYYPQASLSSPQKVRSPASIFLPSNEALQESEESKESQEANKAFYYIFESIN